jgi:hypothetical protein
MRLMMLLTSAVALAACSGKPPAPQAAGVQHPPAHAAPWQELQKDKQRAQAVQQTVDQQAAEQRRQIEAAQQ